MPCYMLYVLNRKAKEANVFTSCDIVDILCSVLQNLSPASAASQLVQNYLKTVSPGK